MTLLYSAAVRLQAAPVRRRGLSVRFSGGFAGPRKSMTGRPSGLHAAPLLGACRSIAMFPQPLLARR